MMSIILDDGLFDKMLVETKTKRLLLSAKCIEGSLIWPFLKGRRTDLLPCQRAHLLLLYFFRDFLFRGESDTLCQKVYEKVYKGLIFYHLYNPKRCPNFATFLSRILCESLIFIFMIHFWHHFCSKNQASDIF